MHNAAANTNLRKLSVIIPCCNEEEALPALVEKLTSALAPLRPAFSVEVIFVDDGSTDRTWEQLCNVYQALPIWTTVLARHDHNRGLGVALRTGFERSTGDVVVTVDADGTYPFSIIQSLVAAIDSGADIATASPYHRLGHVEDVSGVRLIFSRGASLLYRVVVDRHIATYTAMVRGYRANVLSKSISNESGFLSVAMTLVEAIRRGAVVTEVPATLSRRQVGRSKARLAKITSAHLRYLSHLVKLRVTSRFWIRDSEAPFSPISHEVVKNG